LNSIGTPNWVSEWQRCGDPPPIITPQHYNSVDKNFKFPKKLKLQHVSSGIGQCSACNGMGRLGAADEFAYVASSKAYTQPAKTLLYLQSINKFRLENSI
jgi:hypothetical protein